MNTIIIDETKSSPYIELNSNGRIIIKGRSIIEDTYTFFKPMIEWVKNADIKVVTVEIRLEYMNTSSSKQLLTLLKAIAANSSVNAIYVKWFYEEDDEDMLDLGKDYESLLHIPFDFYEFTSEAS